jgi:rSAM/selenodomain-associated transferase 2
MVSIVVPTLNEAAVLPLTLAAVRSAADGRVYEIIVADGGSTDGTLEVAQALGCACLRAPRAQRAAQMNAGAAGAHGSVLLFLHADTLLPRGALGSVETACGRAGVAGGGFARRYQSPSRWLRLTCWLAEWRNHWFGWHLGDQALFVRREVFEQLGGFSDFDVFEDVDFSRRLARAGAVRTLYPRVVSSARRFAGRGPFRRSLADAWLMLRYLLGASPHVLHQARAGTPGL